MVVEMHSVSCLVHTHLISVHSTFKRQTNCNFLKSYSALEILKVFYNNGHVFYFFCSIVLDYLSNIFLQKVTVNRLCF